MCCTFCDVELMKSPKQVVNASEIPDGWMGLDNGPDATKEIQVKPYVLRIAYK
jgi:hypothetical protein